LDGEEDGSDLKGGRPIALENIETDAAELVNIGVVNLGQESDLRRCHRVIIWEE